MYLIRSQWQISSTYHIHYTLRPGGKALTYVWALEQGGSRRGWTEGGEQDVMVPWVMRGSKRLAQAESAGQSVSEDRTFHRYYHLYRKGELESDVVQAGGEVVEAGYEKDNWWVVATPRQST
ncbi:tRNA methyltransferase, has a role in tRNA modification [Elasticomyces elasticus]|nr:tRNA methyltransferase, has a role in tRNA modification [Elasticomyces elasticus]KAK3666522.1 tRNA methyltransferase, has a role in tRNA modification [Elasticomyces elasticus]KAK4928345.1 tRNA methyltransferase, has a role in tRNA modification [Elasticomyces elasticus]KAK5763908.1 tRNA methyltransferase, has a role in tRNA modification [Elasticomyces elasticus]